MSVHIVQFSGPLKAEIARRIHQKLSERKEAGPPEPGLDAFVSQVGDIAAQLEAHMANSEQESHVDLGRNVEVAWVDVMIRLRRYIDSRAGRKDLAKQYEGKTLLRPLLDAIQKHKTNAAARPGRRARALVQAPNGSSGIANRMSGGSASAAPPSA